MSAIVPWNDPGGTPCCCTICEDTGLVTPAPRPYTDSPKGGLRNIPIDANPRPYHYKRIDGATYEAIQQNGFAVNYEFNIDPIRDTLANGPFTLTASLPYNGNCVTTFFDLRSYSLTDSPFVASTWLGFFIAIQDSEIINRTGYPSQENLQTWANKEVEPAPTTNSPIIYFYGYSGFPGFVFDGHLFTARVPVAVEGSAGFEDLQIATIGNASPPDGTSITFLGDPVLTTFSGNFLGLSVSINISIAAP